MIEKNPLRHFSVRRRLRRRANPATVPKRNGTANARRVWLSVRSSVLRQTVTRLTAAGKLFRMSRARLVGAILDWFAAQPRLIQARIAGHPRHVQRAGFSEIVLQKLLNT